MKPFLQGVLWGLAGIGLVVLFSTWVDNLDEKPDSEPGTWLVTLMDRDLEGGFREVVKVARFEKEAVAMVAQDLGLVMVFAESEDKVDAIVDRESPRKGWRVFRVRKIKRAEELLKESQ